jgi:hypothetical protein
MSDAVARDRNALIRRVDELAQRQQQTQEEVPLLTEVVDPVAPAAPRMTVEELEEMAGKLEHAVLEQLGPEVDRAIGAAHANLKAEISASIRRAVREALAPLSKT